ncbi:MAG: hypothetical protein U0R64_01355 [Candidatus Nanopelagicales bacterium]
MAGLLVRVGVGVAAAATLFAGGATAAEAGTKITPETFGIHSNVQKPGVSAGAFRMACTPLWRQVELGRHSYDWRRFDFMVNRAHAWGYSDIMYTFCGTPTWAGKSVSRPTNEIFGPRSTSAPAKMSYYRDYVTAVVKRYKGRITSYQAWNEITSPQFFQGTAKQMAKMTKILNTVVAKYDPRATVVAASVQTHYDSYYQPMAPPYFKALKKLRWPVDVVAGHFYPAGKGGPDTRMQRIAMLQKDLRKYKKPRRVAMWDTEANFWTSVPSKGIKGKVRGKKAATFLARNYLDTWRSGLKRSYWYIWTVGAQDLNFPGVQLRTGDPATTAYNRLAAWTVGSRFSKCKTKGTLVRCSFRKGSSFEIAFTTKGKKRLKVKGSKTVTPVYGGGTKPAKRKTTITTLPVRIG